MITDDNYLVISITKLIIGDGLVELPSSSSGSVEHVYSILVLQGHSRSSIGKLDCQVRSDYL